jgi:hypothetical protein
VSYLKRGLSVALLGVAGIGAFFAGTGRAGAVPVFSRKYQTSCQTCHAIFPKLNPFGEAFRLNGYRMPAETEEQVKQAPVSLGSEAYKRVWPSMVWPSDLPGSAPVAINVKMADIYASSHDESGRTIIHNDFQFPQEANLFSAGTLGDHFSFFGEITYGENPDGSSEVEIEHARLDVDSVFGPEHLINFRIGKLAPNLYDGFQEMWIMTNNGIDTLFAYNPIGIHGGTGLAEDGGGIGLPGNMRAIEMYGVAAHRFFYTVGIGNGIGPGASDGTFGNSSRKDWYARADYKIGGMGLDGDTTGVTMPPENWREKSLRLGVFGYSGDGSKIDYDITDDEGNPFVMRDRRYNRLGAYASWYFGDLNVFGVVLHGTDRLQLLDTGGAEVNTTRRSYDAWFAQADYVILPPLQVSLRYEHLRPGDRSAPSIRTVNANASFLVRANIKAMLEYNRDAHDAKNYTLATVLRFAY